MIVHVAARAAGAGADSVVVATDDPRIEAAVTAAGFSAMLTRADHASGSDRVMEVAERRGWPEDAIVVNVQGDEPLIPTSAIRQVAARLGADPELACATLCERIVDSELIFDPNVVKVVTSNAGRALYFSRAPIPWSRDGFREPRAPTGTDVWRRHVGIYGYRLRALARFVALPRSELERVESLEQLRLLENGLSIHVDEAEDPVPAGVDTPADLERVRMLLGAH
jgi:3-deoxy-manno-octulosonate cytidylyltransferase (CMP-KDO synthetase)